MMMSCKHYHDVIRVIPIMIVLTIQLYMKNRTNTVFSLFDLYLTLNLNPLPSEKNGLLQNEFGGIYLMKLIWKGY